MKRLVIMAVLIFAVGSMGIGLGSAYGMEKNACCKGMSECAQSFQRQSCCLSDNATGNDGVLPQVERIVTTPMARVIITTLPLQLACGDNPPLDQDDDESTEESSLYLTNSVFLI